MINMAVFNLKDIIKYLLKITIVIAVLIGLIKYFSTAKDSIKEQAHVMEEISFISCLDTTIPGISTLNQKQEEVEKKNLLEMAWQIQLGMLSCIENINIAKNDNSNNENNEEANKDNKKEEKEEELQKAETGLKTEVQKSNVPNKYTAEYNSVKIKNETNYKLTKEVLTPNVTVKKDNILIFHTHTCESYTSSEKYSYEMTGSYRTTDLNYTVARVGDELEKHLKKLNFNVIHDKTYHDFPAYSGSYDRSYETVSKILQENNGVDVVFDLHRDAIGSDGSYAPTVKIGEEYAAQLMFVIGTNGGGLEHPNWQNNLKVAIKIQQTAEKLYPGLFKPIVVRDSRYNQNLANGASIIEVGATGNTLEQCMISMKYLSIVLSEVMK